jgi:hypothetical protein
MKNTPVNSPLRTWKLVSGAALLGLCITAVGCGTADLPPGQTQKGNPVPTGPFVLTVASVDTPAEVDFTDGTGATVGSITGTSTFTLNYAGGTQVTLAAPNFSGLEIFSKWSGCTASVGPTCKLTMTSSTTVTAVYVPQISITLQPQIGGPNGCCTPPYYMILGQTQQIYAHFVFLNNQTDANINWTVVSSDPAFSPGTIDSNGNYVAPYPAPPYVTITAVSTFDPLSAVSVVINLGEPSTQPGPVLTVDTSAVIRPISPLIYGVNQLGDSETSLSSFVPTLDRWGGYTASRYNYLLDLTNTTGAGGNFYENIANTNTAFPDTSAVNSQISLDQSGGIASVITMPMLGYVSQSPDSTKRGFACAFSIAKYGAQTGADPNHPDCGNAASGVNSGQYVNWSPTAVVTVGSGSNAVTVTGGPTQITDPKDTSVAVDQTFDAGWVSYLVGKYKNAASGGVAIYELDNEPEYWFYNQNDLHPTWTTYDDITNNGIAYATAIKAADPTAAIGGPTVSGYYYYTDSLADQILGYGGKPAADKASHGGVPFLQYYLEQMSAASKTAGVRLLDYLDVHANQFTSGTGADPAGAPGGNTAVQLAREDSVRLFYDSTYMAGGNTYDLIPYLQGLVTANYPGTKTAITDYSFGGEESISGAIAQAEALAVFGTQGLDMAAMTSVQGHITDSTNLPAQIAFNFFLNYDGAGSKFGDGSLSTGSTTTAPDPVTGLPVTTSGTSQLAIYAAKRSSDGKITVLVFNKTYQDETSSVAITTSATSAKVFQYDIADLTKITSQPAATVTSGSVSLTFPAQSITLLEF